MFEFLLTVGAKLDIKNRLNYTPLTLAAKLARVEVKFKNLNFSNIKIENFFLDV